MYHILVLNGSMVIPMVVLVDSLYSPIILSRTVTNMPIVKVMKMVCTHVIVSLV